MFFITKDSPSLNTPFERTDPVSGQKQYHCHHCGYRKCSEFYKGKLAEKKHTCKQCESRLKKAKYNNRTVLEKLVYNLKHLLGSLKLNHLNKRITCEFIHQILKANNVKVERTTKPSDWEIQRIQLIMPRHVNDFWRPTKWSVSIMDEYYAVKNSKRHLDQETGDKVQGPVKRVCLDKS